MAVGPKASLRRKLLERLCMDSQKHTESEVRSETLTIPELEQSKVAVLNTLASIHSRRSYTFAINRFIAWYCSEPRLTFNRAVVVRYRSHLENTRLSASTINLHLSAIRRLADESAESGRLTRTGDRYPASPGREAARTQER
jgi:Phage integrase, N-terminal SAM-like domain